MTLKLLKCLVVDDEHINCEISQAVLGVEGHDVTCVKDGLEAVALLKARRQAFDLVMMDVAMPTMDGIEAIRQLRADPVTCDLPILCVSAKASGRHKARGLAAGADRYLTKPYRRKELLGVVQEMLAARGVLKPDETIMR